MPFSIPTPTSPTFTHLSNSFAADDVLTDGHLQEVCDELNLDFASGEGHIWGVVLTLMTFLLQVASTAKTCVAAVATASALRIALGLSDCSSNTGAYCKARVKLPETLFSRLTCDVASRLEELTPRPWLWHGRRVHVIDGTTVTAADTPANQEVYPQRDHLPGGVGFPLVRWVGLFSLATAACLDAGIGPYSGKGAGETTLARPLIERHVKPGDVVLGDRLFATYWMIAEVQASLADGLFRLHAHRDREGCKGASRLERRQGLSDNVLIWSKPKRPEWMTQEIYDSMPNELRVRVIWHRIEKPGFRVREITLVTTMLDAEEYPIEELAPLYRRRWAVELNMRTIKQTMKMEHLTSKTPEMLRKELWAHLLSYNLIRNVQTRAAREHGRTPDRLSFTVAKQQLEKKQDLLTFTEGEARQVVLRSLWRAICQQTVGNRPDRIEPRQVKKGPKGYPRLRISRRQAIKAILRAWEEEEAAEVAQGMAEIVAVAEAAAQGAAAEVAQVLAELAETEEASPPC
jgi:putative transposase